jgi:hypothetical protein
MGTPYLIGKGKTGKGKGKGLELIMWKEKVDIVLAKGATPAEGKWNNNDIKVMIQWFKRNGDKSMPKNKDGLLLRYREVHTRGVTTHPREAADATPVGTAAVAVAAARLTHNPSRSSHGPNIFALAAAGNTAASHASHDTLDAASHPRTPADGAIVAAVTADSALAIAHNPSHTPPTSPPLEWNDTPFDVGIHLDMEAHPMLLCHEENESENSSDDDNDDIFVDLSRD